MSLQSGEWKINDNGVESTLTIGSVNPKNGEVTGQIATVGNFVGVWDETLAGFVQVIDLPAAIENRGNARRTIFGWFAQITEVA